MDDRYATRDELRALWLEISRIKDRQSEVTNSIDVMRQEFSAQTQRMHKENREDMTGQREDMKEFRATLKVINASLDELLLSKARFDGGTSVARGVLSALRSPLGKMWLWIVGLGWLVTQVTAEKVERLRLWLIGS